MKTFVVSTKINCTKSAHLHNIPFQLVSFLVSLAAAQSPFFHFGAGIHQWPTVHGPGYTATCWVRKQFNEDITAIRSALFTPILMLCFPSI